MGFKQIKITSFIFVSILLFVSGSNAQDKHSESLIEVSLRMIGHQVLVESGDITSRVLPIIKEDDRYRIQFESEFEFNPEELVSTIDRVVRETKMATIYIVEVEQCDTRELVYSFKIDNSFRSDIIPCKTRTQPKSCYSLLFTLLEPNATNTALSNAATDSSNGLNAESSRMNYIIIALLLVVTLLVFFFLWKKEIHPG